MVLKVSPSDRTVRPARPPAEMVTVSVRQGLEAADILRLRGTCGAVLDAAPAGAGDGTLGFLVPPGTAEEWRLPGSACSAARFPEDDSGWLVRPRETAHGPLTDPAALRSALGEARRTLAAGAGLPAWALPRAERRA